MKKIIAILLVVLSLHASASAQVKFGLKGGLDVINMSLSNNVFDASNRAGFFIVQWSSLQCLS